MSCLSLTISETTRVLSCSTLSTKLKGSCKNSASSLPSESCPPTESLSRKGPKCISFTDRFGSNKRVEKPRKKFFEYIVENFEDQMLRILCGAAAVSFVIGVSLHGLAEGCLEGMAIFVAVILIVSVTAFNNYTKDQQFRKLSEQSEMKNIDVIRNSKIISMSIYNLLVGDIVQLSTGDILPADGLLFQSSNVTVDESSITGETNLIKKGPPKAN